MATKENKDSISNLVSTNKIETELLTAPLEERRAIFFHKSSMKPIEEDELPDEFFEVTISDIQSLYKEAIHQREQLENAPFKTSAQRQMEEDMNKLSYLNKYKHAIIRVQFPNQIILQAIFRPLEKVESIFNFIKNFIDNPEKEFELFTTPPKKILSVQDNLYNQNLVPNSIIYYSGESDLKPEIKQRVTDLSSAVDIEEITAKLLKEQGRLQTNESEQKSVEAAVDTTNTDTKINHTTKSETNSKKKVPKWFKLK